MEPQSLDHQDAQDTARRARRTVWIACAAVLVLVGAAVGAVAVAADDADDAAPESATTIAPGADHGDDGEHGHGTDDAVPVASRCDGDLNVAAYYAESNTAGVDTETGYADPHAHGHSATGGDGAEMGEVQAVGQLMTALAMDDGDYDAWLASVAGPRDPGAPDDTGRGGHLGPHPWTALTDAATCAQLDAEIAHSREIALQYPKGRDAKAAGWIPVTPYVPGIAAHFMRFDYVDGNFDLDEPEMLLFDGTGDDANILGLSYYVVKPGDDEPAAGFTGDNDHYHRHVGLCVKGTMVIGDTTTTAEDCAAMGGVKADGSDGWMNHVWSVPGCESPWGLFSGINPVLDGALGNTAGQGAPCSSSGSRTRFDLTPGTAATTG